MGESKGEEHFRQRKWQVPSPERGAYLVHQVGDQEDLCCWGGESSRRRGRRDKEGRKPQGALEMMMRWKRWEPSGEFQTEERYDTSHDFSCTRCS